LSSTEFKSYESTILGRSKFVIIVSVSGPVLKTGPIVTNIWLSLILE